jgi:hypothetical protein
MRLEYTLSRADWIALADHYVASAPTYRRSIMMVRIVTPVATALALSAFSRDDLSNLTIALIVLVTGVVTWFAIPRSIRASVRSFTLRQTRVCHEGPHVLELRPDGLYSSCARGESTLAWMTLDGVTETPTHMFVMLGEAYGFAVPRRGVTSGDLDTFAASLRARLIPAEPSR